MLRDVREVSGGIFTLSHFQTHGGGWLKGNYIISAYKHFSLSDYSTVVKLGLLACGYSQKHIVLRMRLALLGFAYCTSSYFLAGLLPSRKSREAPMKVRPSRIGTT